jgi:16S rRNA (guanine(966)-N(2))-methyltransferase RsmD
MALPLMSFRFTPGRWKKPRGSKLRIIAGTFRGQTFKTPPGDQSRPTLSRVRESLFDILMPFIRDAVFLDAYAGAGSIGLEALSRGAQQVTLIEADRKLGRILQENVRKFDPEQRRAQVLLGDAHLEIKKILPQGRKFDIIFLDPPYQQAEITAWEQEAWLPELLAPVGMLIFQHARKAKICEEWGVCRMTKQRKYGNTTLSFFAIAKP